MAHTRTHLPHTCIQLHCLSHLSRTEAPREHGLCSQLFPQHLGGCLWCTVDSLKCMFSWMYVQPPLTSKEGELILWSEEPRTILNKGRCGRISLLERVLWTHCWGCAVRSPFKNLSGLGKDQMQGAEVGGNPGERLGRHTRWDRVADCRVGRARWRDGGWLGFPQVCGLSKWALFT